MPRHLCCIHILFLAQRFIYRLLKGFDSKGASPVISARNKRSADKSRINNQNEIKYFCQKDVELRVIYDKKAQGALDAEQADAEIKTIYGKYRQIAISMTEEDALPIANSRARIASGLAAKLWHAHRAAQSN